MRDANFASQRFSAHAAAGPRLIAIGLAILIAATWIPSLPVLTAMAVLALGATYATLVRFRRSPLLLSVLLIHAATYATLYLLFVGATLPLGVTATSRQLGLVNVLDLSVSWVFLGLAVSHIVIVLRRE
jgi:hypothetical protein